MARDEVRAMWVWNTQELLLDEAAQDELFAFCNAKNISEIFAQVVVRFEGSGAGTRCLFRYQEENKAFLKRAHEAGVRVHALDGHPAYVLKDNHPKVLALVEAVMKWNHTAPQQARYFGIHLDNEPYLLPAFKTNQKGRVLQEFLELNAACARRLRDQESDLVYGVDVPFWFSQSGAEDASLRIPFGGEEKSVGHHLIDIVHNIGIMDYRNFAGGPDGLVHHAEDELQYASGAGKKVYIGIETSRSEPSDIWFIAGLDGIRFKEQVDLRKGGLGSDFDFRGYRVHTLEEGEKMHVGLAAKKGLGPDEDPKLKQLLLQLGADYGRAYSKEDTASGRTRALRAADDAGFALSGNREYRDFKPGTLEDTSQKVFYPTFRTRHVMLDKITFEGKREEELEQVLSEARTAFVKNPSFYGYAIHYYKSYKELCKLR